MTDRDLELLARRLARHLGSTRADPFFTPATLAQRLALSERTVRTMLARGVIPSYKVEGARRIDPADVDRYLAGRREESAV